LHSLRCHTIVILVLVVRILRMGYRIHHARCLLLGLPRLIGDCIDQLHPNIVDRGSIVLLLLLVNIHATRVISLIHWLTLEGGHLLGHIEAHLRKYLVLLH